MAERITSNLKGISFVRALIALSRASGMTDKAADVLCAQHPYDRTALDHIERTAVSAGNTSDASWASPLVQTAAAIEFFDLLRSESVSLGRLTGMRKTAFNIPTAVQSSGVVLGWDGESAPAPVGKLQVAAGALAYTKLSGIVAISRELFRFGPLAEQAVLNDLVKGSAYFDDSQFLDPSVSAIANVKPASVLNGITPTQSTGATAVAIAADLATALAVLADADEVGPHTYWVMTPADAARLAAKRDTQGGPAFPQVTARGGTLLGLPVLTSNAVPHAVSAGSIVALVNGEGIALASSGAVVETSDQASIELQDAPTASGTTGAQLVSAWQENLRLFRVGLGANWMRTRSTAATYIDNVHW